MTRMTKVLLILSIVLLGAGIVSVSGLVAVRSAVAVYVMLPAGAIFFGLFLVFKLLEKEIAAYDEEQRKLLSAITRAAQTDIASMARQVSAEDTAARPLTKAA